MKKMIWKSKGVKEVWRDASCFWRLLWGHWALADLGINGRGCWWSRWSPEWMNVCCWYEHKDHNASDPWVRLKEMAKPSNPNIKFYEWLTPSPQGRGSGGGLETTVYTSQVTETWDGSTETSHWVKQTPLPSAVQNKCSRSPGCILGALPQRQPSSSIPAFFLFIYLFFTMIKLILFKRHKSVSIWINQ